MVASQRAVTIHNTLSGMNSTYGGLLNDVMQELEVLRAECDRLGRELAAEKAKSAKLTAALGRDLTEQASVAAPEGP